MSDEQEIKEFLKLREFLQNEIIALKITVNENQISQLLKYSALLKAPPVPVRVTGLHSNLEILYFHIVDSFFAIQCLQAEPGTSLIDVGAGNGVPGLVFKIICPSISLTSLEATKKKIEFLNSVKDLLNIKDWNIVQGRAEDLGHNQNYRELFNVAVCKGLAHLAMACELILPFVCLDGAFVALKGPKGVEEVKEAMPVIELLGGEVKEIIHYDLPGFHAKRVLVVVKKAQHSLDKFPRRLSAIRRQYRGNTDGI